MTIIVVSMNKKQFTLVYPFEMKQHLKTIERKHYSLFRQTIEEQLRFEPDVETNNRKPLRQPAMGEAEWEIRFGPNNRFRVLYEVDRDHLMVSILAIGVKVGNQLVIGDEEL